MTDYICETVYCTGCSACASICPASCIKMLPDKEGFLRPEIDESFCIKCEKCKKTCPINNLISDNNVKPLSFAARNKNTDIRFESSSGGIFSNFAIQVLNNNGAVVAAGFDENFYIKHKICFEIDKLDELRKSKYVQSDIGDAFIKSKELLDGGVSLLFCGTPCQIAGLKQYLGKNYSNLYTIDFICHGVPSPLAWKKYIEYREKLAGSPVSAVSFRSKESGWQGYSMKILFENGTQYSSKLKDDEYLHSFIMNMILRPSCYNCKFKTVHHVSDITLADFWSFENLTPEWNDDTGISSVMIHSDKGEELFDSIKNDIEYKSVFFDESIKNNSSMLNSSPKPLLRDRFMKDIKKMSYNDVHAKYCGNSILSKIRRKLAIIKN